MEERKPLKMKSTYSSSILKFKQRKKVSQNGAVTTISAGKITSLENLAELYIKAKSMMELGANDFYLQKQVTLQRKEIQPSENDEVQDMDSLFADSSKSSMSLLDDDPSHPSSEPNYYHTSIMACTQIKEPEQLIDKDLINLLGFVKKIQKQSHTDQSIAASLQQNQVEFGEYTRHKTLIWDLDETLIHAQLLIPPQQQHQNSDFTISLSNGAQFAVSVRPYVQKTLEFLSDLYEMAVFTAAEQEYADAIIDQIDPNKKYFVKRLYRQHCTPTAEDNFYLKDLGIITDRDPEEILIVDNCIISFALQLSNGIPICAYFSQNKHQDQELLFLVSYLEEVHGRKDVREANRQTFKLEEFMEKL